MSETSPKKLPPIPKIALEKIPEVRRTINDLVAFGLDGQTVEGDVYHAFTGALYRDVLKSRGIDLRVAYTTVNPLLGRDLTPAVLDEFAQRVAGNLHRLKTGIPALPYRGLGLPEWMPLEVATVEHRNVRTKSRQLRRGAQLTLAVLAGSCYPRSLTIWWSQELAGYAARRLGFSPKRYQKMPLKDTRQLTRLRFWGLFDPEKSLGDEPRFGEIACTSSMLTYNRRILKRRFRNGANCPWGWTHACHRCAVGYTGKDGVDACIAATHPLAYYQDLCTACGERFAVFDKASVTPKCIKCIAHDLLHPD